MSHVYSHIVTSCFLDTILVPLCTWVYIIALVGLFALSRGKPRASPQARYPQYKASNASADGKATADAEMHENAEMQLPVTRRSKIHLILTIVYNLLLLAQILMCILEIARLSLADLGIGLLPFTFVSILVAGVLHATRGASGRIRGWRWANLVVWIALAIMNSIKIAEEVKEGLDTRKGSKYPESDEIIDVSVMVGVYVALGILEILAR